MPKTLFVALMCVIATGGLSAASAANGCAPNARCLSVTGKGEPAPEPSPYTAQCSGRFPDFIVPTSMMPSNYSGPWFVLSQHYPEAAPAGDAPWLDIHFKDGVKAANDYLYALREYAFEGMIEADFRPENNTARDWYHMPLMNFGPGFRELAHGVTQERTVTGPELGLKPGVSIHDYAIGFYNRAGAVTIRQVWNEADPDLGKVRFASGTMSFKILFSDAMADDFQDPASYPLSGAPAWTIVTTNGTRTVRLMQMDVAAVDPDSPTGWVFGTFAFDKDAPDTSPWRRLRPVGISWGNDYRFTPSDQAAGDALKQTTISDQIPDYARSHLGWAGRTNGPVDNPISGCLSCHGTAQFPVAADLAPFNKKCDTDAKRMFWFRDFSGDQAFGAMDRNECMPMQSDQRLVALDFSLQMMVAVQSVKQFGDANPCTPSTVEAFSPVELGPFADAPRVQR